MKMFSDEAAKEETGTALKILDVAELVAMNLRNKRGSAGKPVKEDPGVVSKNSIQRPKGL